MRTILGLVALFVVGCSDPQAAEPVWYALAYDADGCVYEPDVLRIRFGDRFGGGEGVTLEECASYGDELVSELEAEGYRCGRGCVRMGDGFCGPGRIQGFACDATVDVIVPE